MEKGRSGSTAGIAEVFVVGPTFCLVANWSAEVFGGGRVTYILDDRRLTCCAEVGGGGEVLRARVGSGRMGGWDLGSAEVEAVIGADGRMWATILRHVL